MWPGFGMAWGAATKRGLIGASIGAVGGGISGLRQDKSVFGSAMTGALVGAYAGGAGGARGLGVGIGGGLGAIFGGHIASGAALGYGAARGGQFFNRVDLTMGRMMSARGSAASWGAALRHQGRISAGTIGRKLTKAYNGFRALE